MWPECPNKQMLAMLGRPRSLRAAFWHQYGENSWPGKQLQLPRTGPALIYARREHRLVLESGSENEWPMK
jgi:hypothetical protein